MNRGTRQFAAWIACFAVLLAAIAPTVSRVLAACDSALRNEVCSVANPASSHAGMSHAAHHGAHHVSAADAPDHLAHAYSHDHVSALTPAPAHHDFHFDHCPFCFTHAGSFGLLPTAMFTLPVVTGSFILPALFYQSPQPLFAWTRAQPRAPPVFLS